jgi:hypothetical protein
MLQHPASDFKKFLIRPRLAGHWYIKLLKTLQKYEKKPSVLFPSN